ncbi:hypothetical protein CBR_g50068 [Chara braunii]|uniref:Uncharacterized protein n=1 Tax=Chara braunii TaxID=69332 RepID=A0A388M5W7_CHABU|nr:hypothetical protein CBR_g50068 [Chara braunii]|eukprot:GBG89978.1 hypothetical protein CBR_g50068 [Chara braunii]
MMKTVSAGSMMAAFLFAAMATMLATSPAGATQPLTHCDFYLSCNKWSIPELNICPGGDVAYSRCTGRIMHHVKTDTAEVDIKSATVNSGGCAMSSSADGPTWDTIKCANKFSTVQDWIHKRNLQDDAPWFLNKYIKINISAVQYTGGWGNYIGGKDRDCVMIKTSSDFANPDGSECPI